MELGETVEVVPPADTVAPEGMLTMIWPWDKGTTEEFIPAGLLNKFCGEAIEEEITFCNRKTHLSDLRQYFAILLTELSKKV